MGRGFDGVGAIHFTGWGLQGITASSLNLLFCLEPACEGHKEVNNQRNYECYVNDPHLGRYGGEKHLPDDHAEKCAGD